MISRSGLSPLLVPLDTAGPMARTVRDMATLLDALVGYDPKDAYTAINKAARHSGSYTQHLRGVESLKGARFGALHATAQMAACGGVCSRSASPHRGLPPVARHVQGGFRGRERPRLRAGEQGGARGPRGDESGGRGGGGAEPARHAADDRRHLALPLPLALRRRHLSEEPPRAAILVAQGHLRHRALPQEPRPHQAARHRRARQVRTDTCRSLPPHGPWLRATPDGRLRRGAGPRTTPSTWPSSRWAPSSSAGSSALWRSTTSTGSATPHCAS